MKQLESDSSTVKSPSHSVHGVSSQDPGPSGSEVGDGGSSLVATGSGQVASSCTGSVQGMLLGESPKKAYKKAKSSRSSAKSDEGGHLPEAEAGGGTVPEGMLPAKMVSAFMVQNCGFLDFLSPV